MSQSKGSSSSKALSTEEIVFTPQEIDVAKLLYLEEKRPLEFIASFIRLYQVMVMLHDEESRFDREIVRSITFWDVWRLTVWMRLEAKEFWNDRCVRFNVNLLDDPVFKMTREVTPSSETYGLLAAFDRWYIESERFKRLDEREKLRRMKEEFVNATVETHSRGTLIAQYHQDTRKERRHTAPRPSDSNNSITNPAIRFGLENEEWAEIRIRALSKQTYLPIPKLRPADSTSDQKHNPPWMSFTWNLPVPRSLHFSSQYYSHYARHASQHVSRHPSHYPQDASQSRVAPTQSLLPPANRTGTTFYPYSSNSQVPVPHDIAPRTTTANPNTHTRSYRPAPPSVQVRHPAQDQGTLYRNLVVRNSGFGLLVPPSRREEMSKRYGVRNNKGDRQGEKRRRASGGWKIGEGGEVD
ncbi:MAG: hypothetical protein LQ350_005157 [Teloschistes chrysophthalmus]|nr:MAG: hypothetical protein LQ350_005157 [Niorma chrysophthalma]